MLVVDRYTKIVLSIIALCLVVLCLEQSHWGKVETVQAQGQVFMVQGYMFNGNPYLLGDGPNQKPGIPVVEVPSHH